MSPLLSLPVEPLESLFVSPLLSLPVEPLVSLFVSPLEVLPCPFLDSGVLGSGVLGVVVPASSPPGLVVVVSAGSTASACLGVSFALFPVKAM